MFADVNLTKGPERVLGPVGRRSGLSIVPVRSKIESMKLLVIDHQSVAARDLFALLLLIGGRGRPASQMRNRFGAHRRAH
jgi:hypothetical protein